MACSRPGDAMELAGNFTHTLEQQTQGGQNESPLGGVNNANSYLQ